MASHSPKADVPEAGLTPVEKTPKSHKYLAHIDGLRAIAVLVVIFYHVGAGLSGGFVGVDVFFVISGFLITGLIVRDLDRGHFSLIEFWERRVRRILPAVAVVVAATLVAGWLFFLPSDFKPLAESALAQSMTASNFYFSRHLSYFEAGKASDAIPLLHTWSLSVEEQFYLVFPLFLIGIYRIRRKSLFSSMLLVAIGSLALSIYGSYQHPRSAFFLLPTRAWELLIGSFLAISPKRRSPGRFGAELWSAAGIAGIMMAVFVYDKTTRFPGFAALLPCVGAGLFIWANQNTPTAAGRLLASAPFIVVGQMSYSLYLWHWPILIFSKYWVIDPLRPSQQALMLAGILLASFLSWKFIETPFRKRAFFRSRVGIFSFGIISTTLIAALSATIILMQGIPARMPQAAAFDRVESSGDPRGPHWTRNLDRSLEQVKKGDLVELGTGDKQKPIDIVVVGDSHAMALFGLFDVLCKQYHCRMVSTAHAITAPILGYESTDDSSLQKDSIPFQIEVLDLVRKNHVKHVFFIASWDRYVTTEDGAELQERFRRTVDAYRDVGAQIWIMKEIPVYPWSVPQKLALASLHGRDLQSIALTAAEYHRSMDPLMTGLFGGVQGPDVTFLDPAEYLIDSRDRCRVVKNGESLYSDKTHLSVIGEMELRPLFEPIFKKISEEPKAPASAGPG